jgi:hypothetical protein
MVIGLVGKLCARTTDGATMAPASRPSVERRVSDMNFLPERPDCDRLGRSIRAFPYGGKWAGPGKAATNSTA